MQTIHIVNQPFQLDSPIKKWILVLIATGFLSLIMFAPGFKLALLIAGAIALGCGCTYLLLLKATVKYTLTATHFQQHLFHGGWVVKWSDIIDIGVCEYQHQGWHHPLPWIGIKLRRYSPYLDSICPRIASQILLDQRSLLFLGLRQHNQHKFFEDRVLDTEVFIADNGHQYKGLLAMLANRMGYQRNNYGYDVFISASDLDRPIDEFVGLLRRYLAAADQERNG